MFLTHTIPEHYVDGIGKARYSGGVVRLDLISATETFDTQENDAPITVNQRLIMSPEAFVRTVKTLKRLSDQLVEAGVLKRARPSTTADSNPDTPV